MLASWELTRCGPVFDHCTSLSGPARCQHELNFLTCFQVLPASLSCTSFLSRSECIGTSTSRFVIQVATFYPIIEKIPFWGQSLAFLSWYRDVHLEDHTYRYPWSCIQIRRAPTSCDRAECGLRRLVMPDCMIIIEASSNHTGMPLLFFCGFLKIGIAVLLMIMMSLRTPRVIIRIGLIFNRMLWSLIIRARRHTPSVSFWS